MTVTIPTASSIKMRFPEFADVADPVVEFAIEEARVEVGETWIDATASIALAYLVAHYVAASRARTDGSEEGAIASETIGRISVSYANKSSSSTPTDVTDKESSSYGRRYLEILTANFSGPVIV